MAHELLGYLSEALDADAEELSDRRRDGGFRALSGLLQGLHQVLLPKGDVEAAEEVSLTPDASCTVSKWLHGGVYSGLLVFPSIQASH